MSNKLIPLALNLIERGEIGVVEAAALTGTTQPNISQWMERRGITPRKRVDARNAWVRDRWQLEVMNILGAQATCTIDMINKLSLPM